MVAIYELADDALRPLDETSFASAGIRERDDLQRLLRERIDVLCNAGSESTPLLVIAEEFGDWEDSRRRIDLLAIDKNANLVVIELKRSHDGGHMDLQAIRYAAMVSTMTFSRAVEIFAEHLRKLGRDEEAEQTMLEFLNWDEMDEDEFAQDVRIILAAAEFSRELTTAVLWLNERQLDIRCVRLRPYLDGKRVFLDVQQVIPLPEAAAYQVQLREKQQQERAERNREPWNGRDWYANYTKDRPWDDARKFGFISAGGGPRWGPRMHRLPVGGRVFVNMPSVGYIGVGIVTEAAKRADAFTVQLEGQEQSILELRPQYAQNASDPEHAEYFVRVRWLRACGQDEAVRVKGLFANQSVACKLRDSKTIEAVSKHFGIRKEASDEIMRPVAPANFRG